MRLVSEIPIHESVYHRNGRGRVMVWQEFNGIHSCGLIGEYRYRIVDRKDHFTIERQDKYADMDSWQMLKTAKTMREANAAVNVQIANDTRQRPKS
jgi:hypothetical protein